MFNDVREDLKTLNIGDEVAVSTGGGTLRYTPAKVTKRTKTQITVSLGSNSLGLKRFNIETGKEVGGFNYYKDQLVFLSDKVKAHWIREAELKAFYPLVERLKSELHYPNRLSSEQIKRLTELTNELFPIKESFSKVIES